MKRILLISLAVLVLQAPGLGQAKPQTFNVLLAGGAEANTIKIWLTPDGRSYVIDSGVPLEVGGDICANPEGNPNELICRAPMIASFEVNAEGGDDRVAVARKVSIPVTMRGGPGHDLLIGGAGDDKLVGGAGDDKLVGWHGDDALFGGPGADALVGGHGDDLLRGGPGKDTLLGGPGDDDVRQFNRKRQGRG